MADTAATTDAAPQQEVLTQEAAAPEVPKPETEVPAPAVAASEVPKPETEVPAPEVPKTETEVTSPEVAEQEVPVQDIASTEVAATEVAPTEEAATAEGGEKKETYASLPKPKYNPMHSHKVHHSRSYASTIIADQEMLLANLRNMRRALEKEDRQLSIMAKTLFNQEYPRKWTPPNSYKNEGDLRGGYALIHISKRSSLY